MGFVLTIFCIFLYHCLSLFVSFFWSFSAIVLSVILRMTASENHFGFCKLFGKKHLGAYVVLFYYVPNKNKVFLSYLISYLKRSWYVMTVTSTNRKGKNAWEIPSLKTYLTSIMIRGKNISKKELFYLHGIYSIQSYLF